ncbi:hypothetical protein HVY77_08375 [Escherichia coli]|uniref:Uncharacterized protein n=2 Tax=Escherichia coli TaxID=562 RepID=A0A7H9SD56_ECOLX|nr:hypothetical protein [Escherichia coli]EFR1647825.1 hypothetical protein [Salmonella enterica]ELY4545551.1 hypothetical protein [Cronobacter sakazakii]EES1182130.1 hypothetical protein [Escherichia coli]EEV1512814.1 hypothetical protein [Escherichia coli]ELY5803043.1 hypothetical protein [Cronobacter sakazakii]
MSSHEEVIKQMKKLLDTLEQTPVQAVSQEHPAATIRDLALKILTESNTKYPAGFSVTVF